MLKLIRTFLLFAAVNLAIIGSALAVDLEWDANPDGQGVLGYYLYWQRADEQGETLQATINDRLNTHITIANPGNFIEGIQYNLWLTAFNSAEESGPSNIVTYDVPWPGGGGPIIPDQPNGLRFSDTQGTLITDIKVAP